MIKKLIFLTWVISNYSFADAYESGKINKIQIEGSRLLMVWLDSTDDKSECSGGNIWTIHNSDLLFQEKVSILLTAYTTGQEVKLRHLTSEGCGNWDSNKVYSIQMGGIG